MPWFGHEERRKLDLAADTATRALTIIESHVRSCDQRAERAERDSKAYRDAMTASVAAVDSKIGKLGYWTVGLVLSVGGTIIVGLVTALVWTLAPMLQPKAAGVVYMQDGTGGRTRDGDGSRATGGNGAETPRMGGNGRGGNGP